MEDLSHLLDLIWGNINIKIGRGPSEIQGVPQFCRQAMFVKSSDTKFASDIQLWDRKKGLELVFEEEEQIT